MPRRIEAHLLDGPTGKLVLEAPEQVGISFAAAAETCPGQAIMPFSSSMGKLATHWSNSSFVSSWPSLLLPSTTLVHRAVRPPSSSARGAL